MPRKMRLTHEALSDFFSGVHTMLSAGYPISDCVALIAEEEKDRRAKALYTSLSDELMAGALFGEALAQSGAFPENTASLIGVGERVGKLEESIASAARFHADRHRIKKQLKDAVTYPLILVFLMLVVVAVLLTRVIPVFDQVYASLGGSMTGAAGGMLSIGRWLSDALPTIVTVTVSVIGVAAVLFLIPVTRRLLKMIFISIAGDRGIFRAVNRASFASALSMAASGGSTFEEGVSFAARILGDNRSAKKRIDKCIAMLDDGVLLEDALLKTKLLPPSSCRLLKIGMRSGSGDRSMEQIAERLGEEAEQKIADTIALIEPALVIITSLVTGAILLTVMLPLINIMNVI